MISQERGSGKSSGSIVSARGRETTAASQRLVLQRLSAHGTR
jgi:hypothetical protein